MISGHPWPLLDPPPAFTCPKCGRKSWNDSDARHGWCSACQDYTAPPTPPKPEPFPQS